MRVSVYFNLHRKLFSIRSEEGSQKGRVVAHATTVVVEDTHFVISKYGQDRVRRERKKNVHAFVRGTLLSANGCPVTEDVKLASVHEDPILSLMDLCTPFHYDPYRMDRFQYQDEKGPQDLNHAALAILSIDQTLTLGKKASLMALCPC